MVKKLWSVLLHLPPVAAIVYVWWQVVRWYIEHLPILGVDFFNTVTYVHYLASNWVPRIDGWKNIWWSGHPLEGEYPTLHMYLMAPLARGLGEVAAVQVYMAGSILVFLVFAYLVFWNWSQSRVLAGVIGALATISIAFYGALVWGGSLPYFATQAFLPVVLYLTSVYLQKNALKFLLVAGVVTGLSVWGHPQSAIVYIVPFVVIMLVCYRRIRDLALYVMAAILVAYPEMLTRISVPIYYLPVWIVQKTFTGVFGRLAALVGREPVAQQVTSAGHEGAEVIARVSRENLWLFEKETNPYLLVVAGLVLVLFVMTFRRKEVRPAVVGWLLVAYQVGYVALFAFGVPFFHGGWYRVFWPFPFLLGLAICGMWKSVFMGRIGWGWKTARIVALVGLLATGVWGTVLTTSDFFTKLDTRELAYSEASSAWPAPLNYLGGANMQELLGRLLVPAWLAADDTQHRFYTADAQVNIWWNWLYKMPAFRGYIDPPIGNDRRGGYFWWDVAVNSNQLVEVFKYPEEVAVNNSKFLIDWFAMRYIEAGHSSSSFSPLSKYLDNTEFILRDENITYVDNDAVFRHYLGKGELTLKAVNLPVVYFVGNETAFTAVNDALALGSTDPKLILVRGPAMLDGLSRVEMGRYDGMMLYNYGYNDLAYGNRLASYAVVGDFVRQGKPVFVETGGGVVEADNSNQLLEHSRLPQELPMESAKREYLGPQWQLEIADLRGDTGLDLEKFAPLSWTEKDQITGEEVAREWRFSYPTSAMTGESVVLARNAGRPVLVEKKIGSGRLVWSGMNLALHAFETENEAERKWFRKMFDELYVFPKRPAPRYEMTSPALGKIKISGQGARGVLFPGQTSRNRWKVVQVDGSELVPWEVAIPEKGFFVDLADKNLGSFDQEWQYIGEQNLHYYEVNPTLTSPIFHPTNAAVVGFVGKDNFYESFFRTLGMVNINSKEVIPVRISQNLDQIEKTDLESLDGLVLYGYGYKSDSGWEKISEWVKAGGKLFVDTGGESPDTAARQDLAELLPVVRTAKKGLGTLAAYEGSGEWLGKIHTENFGDPILDGEPWQFSVPEGDLREGTKVLLKQQGIPVLAERSFGRGVVVWSGMNLAYHATVFNAMDEGWLMKRIMETLFRVEPRPVPSGYRIERTNPQKVSIDLTGGARGVLLREQFYDWHAKVDGRPAKIYQTGPTYHGFMYVPLANASGKVHRKVEFRFGGGNYLAYFHYLLAGLTVVGVADYAIFGHRGLSRWVIPFLAHVSLRVRGWWNTEGEN